MKKPSESKKIITSRLRLDPEVADWVRKNTCTGGKSNGYGLGNIPSRATEFFHWYSVYRKGFLIMLIENHYQEIKHLVRIIGRARKNDV